MASIKLVALALYGILATVGVAQPLTAAANLIIAALALPGIVHRVVMRRANRANYEPSV
jgi:hypothetical protein